jgi:hypothetical protein
MKSTSHRRRAGRAAKRQPGPVYANAFARAIEGARTIPSDKVEATKRCMLDAFTAFGQGVACAQHWSTMADALNVAEALAERNICSDEASCERIANGQNVLAAVQDRFAARASWTLYPTERQQLDDALWTHGIQLGFCSMREYEEAVLRVVRRVSGVLAGNAGPGVRVIHGAIGATPCAR